MKITRKGKFKVIEAGTIHSEEKEAYESAVNFLIANPTVNSVEIIPPNITVSQEIPDVPEPPVIPPVIDPPPMDGFYFGVPMPDWDYKAMPVSGSVMRTLDSNNFMFTGTRDNPEFLDLGDMIIDDNINFGGSWGVILGGKFRGKDGSVRVNASHVVMRGSNIEDSDTGWGAALGSFGSDNFVFLESEITKSGNADLDTDVDHHGWKVGGNFIWSINSLFKNCQGDGLQIGDQKNSPDEISNIYIVGNHAEHNLQTGYWIKNASKVLIAYNTAKDHNNGGGSTSASAGGQYGLKDIWFLKNNFSDSKIGIRFASTDDSQPCYVVGNIIDKINATPSDPFGTGWGLQSYSSSHTYWYLNTAPSAAGARSALLGGGNTISGKQTNTNFVDNPDLAPVRQAYKNTFGLDAPF